MTKPLIMGVDLYVSSIDDALPFYRDLVGLHVDKSDGEARFTASGGDDVLVRLIEDSDAERAPRAAGLFHLALLFPDRESLSQALRRLRDAHYSLTGASDHLVSEALYMDDPDGNGIELYCDRPEKSWDRNSSGQVRMDTRPLDLGNLLQESQSSGQQAPADTIMGHVHLEVTDVEASRAFYSDRFGMDKTAERPRARFMSWSGYHHHVGLNSWRARTEARPDRALGLAAVRARIDNALLDGSVHARSTEESSSEPTVRDPDDIIWHVERA